MAITSDQLQIQVQVDTSGAKRPLRDLEGRFAALEDAAAATSKATDKAAASFDNAGSKAETLKHLRKELERAGLSTLQLENTIKQASIALDKANFKKTDRQVVGFTSSVQEASASVDTLGESMRSTTKDATGFDALIDDIGTKLASVSEAVQKISAVLSDLGMVFQFVTDPAMVDRLQKILFILGTVAKFKGLTRVGDMLTSLSSGLGQYKKVLEEIGISAKDFDETLTGWVDKIITVKGLISNFQLALELFAGTVFFAVSTEAELIKTFGELGSAAKKSATIVSQTAGAIRKELFLMRFEAQQMGALGAVGEGVRRDLLTPFQNAGKAVKRLAAVARPALTGLGDNLLTAGRNVALLGGQFAKVVTDAKAVVAPLESMGTASLFTAGQMESYAASARKAGAAIVQLSRRIYMGTAQILDSRGAFVANTSVMIEMGDRVSWLQSMLSRLGNVVGTISQKVLAGLGKAVGVAGAGFAQLVGAVKIGSSVLYTGASAAGTYAQSLWAIARTVEPVTAALNTAYLGASVLFGSILGGPAGAIAGFELWASTMIVSSDTIRKVMGDIVDVFIKSFEGIGSIIGKSVGGLGRIVPPIASAFSGITKSVGASGSAFASWVVQVKGVQKVLMGLYVSLSGFLGFLTAGPVGAVAFAGIAVADLAVTFEEFRKTLAAIPGAVGAGFQALAGTVMKTSKVLQTAVASSIAGMGTSFSNLSARLDAAVVSYRNIEAAFGGFSSVSARISAATKAVAVSFDFGKIADQFTATLSRMGSALTAFVQQGVVPAFNGAASAFTSFLNVLASGAAGVRRGFESFVFGTNTVKSMQMVLANPQIGYSLSAIGGNLGIVRNEMTLFSGVAQGTLVKSVKDIGQATSQMGATFSTVSRGIVTFGKDFSKLGVALFTTHAGSLMLSMAEHAQILQFGLFALGQGLLFTNNKILEFAGILAIAASVLTGGFALAVKATLNTISSVSTAIGDFLLVTMAQFEEKFVKAQVATQFFVGTLKGFRREMGAQVGSIGEWNGLIDEMVQSTLFSREALQKSAAEIIAVGNALGLAKDQQKALLQLIPEHLKAGDDVFDATVGFVQALSGAGQSVIKYGLHVSEAAIDHSKFAKELGVTAAAMDEAQLAQARLSIMIEQSAPKIGMASQQLNTISGAAIQAAKSIESLQVRLGQQGVITVAYYTAISRVTSALAGMPDAIVFVTGSLIDLGGVVLKVAGIIFGLAMPITSTIFLYKLLNFAVTESITVQFLLTKMFALTNTALGVQSIAVVSLATVWSNFVLLLRGVVVTSLVTMKSILVGATAAVWSFTTALLTNPLFLAGAGIVLGLVLVAKAIQRIEEKTGILTRSLAGLSSIFAGATDSASTFSLAMQVASSMVADLISGLVDLTVIAIVPLINGVYGLYYGILQLINVFSPLARVVPGLSGFFGALGDEIAATERTVSALKMAADGSTESIFGFSKGVAYAAENTGPFTGALKLAREALADLKKEMVTGTQRDLFSAEILGLSNQALMLRKKLTEEKLLIAKEVEDKRRLAEDLIKIDLQIIKGGMDAQTEADTAVRDLYLKELERQETIDAIRKAGQVKLEAAIEPLREKLQNLSFLPPVEETAKAMEAVRKVIALTEKDIIADTNKAIKEFRKKQLDDAKKAADALKKIEEKRLGDRQAALSDLAKMGGDELEILKQDNLKQIASYRDMLKTKAISLEEYNKLVAGLGKKVTDKQIEMAREAQDKIREIQKRGAELSGDIGRAARIEADAIADRVDKLREELRLKGLLTKEANAALAAEKAMANARAGGAAAGGALVPAGITQGLNMFQASFSGFADALMAPIAAAKAVVGTAQALVDAVPSLMESVAGLFESIVALPERLLSAMDRIVAAIPRAIAVAIPKLVEALGTILVQLADLIGELIPNAVLALSETLPRAVEKVIEQLPVFVEKLSKGLTTMIPKLVLAWINYTINGMPRMVMALIKAMPDIAAAFVVGFIEGLIELGDIIGKIFTGGLQSYADEFGDSIGDAVKSITGKTSEMFSVAAQEVGARGQDLADRIGSSINSATSRALSLLGQAWEGLKQAAGWVLNGIDDVFKWAIGGLGDIFQWVGDTIFAPFVKGIGDVFQWVMDDVVGGIAEGVGSALSWVNTEVLTPFMDGVGDVFSWVGSEVLEPFFDIVVGAFKWILEEVIFKIPEYIGIGLAMAMDFLFNKLPDLIGDGLRAAWDFLVLAGSKIWEGLKEAGVAAWDFVKSIGGAIWDGLKAGINAAGSFISDIGKSIWNGLSSAADSLGGTFSKIGTKIWDGLASALDTAGNYLAKIFKFEGGGTGTVEDFLGFDFPWFAFAEGGQVPGRARVSGDSSRNDIVPAMLSPGEIVVPRSIVGMGADAIAQYAAGLGRDTGIDAKAGEVQSLLASLGIAPLSRAEPLDSVLSGAESLGSGILGGVLGLGDKALSAVSMLMELGGSVDLGQLFINPEAALKKSLKGLTTFTRDIFLNMLKVNVGAGEVGSLMPSMLADLTAGLRSKIDTVIQNLPGMDLIQKFPKYGEAGVTLNPTNYEAQQARYIQDMTALMDLEKAFIMGPNMDSAKTLYDQALRTYALFDLGTPQGKDFSRIQRMTEFYRKGVTGAASTLSPGGIVQTFAAGGMVPGAGRGDSVPSMLTPGEFVINRSAAQALGRPMLEHLNRGGGAGTTNNVTVNLKIDTEQPIDEKFVRAKLMPEIEKQLKRMSLDGRRVMAQTGVR